jgi:hypothetical protein
LLHGVNKTDQQLMAHSEKYILATEESPLLDEFQSLPFACVRQLFYAAP